MNSIDKNQQEINYQDLYHEEAAARIRQMAESAKTCFFCTESGIGNSGGVRPMSILQVDDKGIIWFLSARDSHKNHEIEMNSEVKLYFQGSAHADFLFLQGRAYLSYEKNKIRELWTPLAKAWFTDGENDPRISVIRFVPENGFYWDNKHGNLVAGVKMLFSALAGKTMDDSIQGTLHT